MTSPREGAHYGGVGVVVGVVEAGPVGHAVLVSGEPVVLGAEDTAGESYIMVAA